MTLQGKNILFLGSSVTYGSASGGISFVEPMAAQCGFTFCKEAVSGTTLADTYINSYVNRLKGIDSGCHFDLFICQLSTNDAAQDIPIAATEQAIIDIIRDVRERFGCPVVFYTSPRFDSPRYARLVELLGRLKAEYGFLVLDLWNDPEMAQIDPETRRRYMHDDLHPNRIGYEKWWTPKFIEFCEHLPE